MVRAVRGYGLVKAGDVAARTAPPRRGGRVVRALAPALHALGSRSGWERPTSPGQAGGGPRRPRQRAGHHARKGIGTSRAWPSGSWGRASHRGSAGLRQHLDASRRPSSRWGPATRSPRSSSPGRTFAGPRGLRRARHPRAGAGDLQSLGTLDGPPRVRAMLAVLGGKGRRLLIVSRSHRDVYQQLGRDLAGDRGVQLVLDRREGEPHRLRTLRTADRPPGSTLPR